MTINWPQVKIKYFLKSLGGDQGIIDLRFKFSGCYTFRGGWVKKDVEETEHSFATWIKEYWEHLGVGGWVVGTDSQAAISRWNRDELREAF